MLNQYPVFIISQYILQPTTEIKKWAKKLIDINRYTEFMRNPMAITTKYISEEFLRSYIIHCNHMIGSNPHPIVVKLLLEHSEFINTKDNCWIYASNPHPKIVKKMLYGKLRRSHEFFFQNRHPAILKILKKTEKNKISLQLLQQNRNKRTTKICMKLLEENPKKINWYSLSRVTNPLILKNKNKIQLFCLEENPDKWAIKIIKKNKNKSIMLATNPSIFYPLYSKSIKYWKQLECKINYLF